MRPIREGPVVILPRGHGVIDVFTERGWDHHSAFKVIKRIPHLIRGYDPLSDQDYQILLQACLKHEYS